MPEAPGRLSDVMEALAAVSDPADRADMLVGLANRFVEVPPDVARRPFPPRHLVPGCESEAYVWGVLGANGTLDLYFAVDNPSGVSARALAVILGRALSGEVPSEIAAVSPDIVYDIFRRDLSMGKGLGLMSMVSAVKATARQAAEALARGEGGPRVFPA
jgi:cysteine desulfuration protein SufE